MRTLTTLACLLIMVLSHDANSQRFESLNDEFPFARARCLIQDSYGFLWFGTIDGLVKYDGVSIRTFRNTPFDSTSLPGQEILAIVENTDSTLLLGFLDEGLVEFNRNTHRSKAIELPGQGDRITVFSMTLGVDSSLWVGTNKGLFTRIDTVFKHYSSDPADPGSLQSAIVTKVYLDRSSDLWVGTRRGIHRLDRETDAFETPANNPSFPTRIIIDIEEDHDDRLWVSVRTGQNRLYTWDSTMSEFSIHPDFVMDGEFRITFDSDNVLWISSRGRGLYKAEQGSLTFFDPRDSWKHGFWGLGVFDIFHDKFGTIWVLGEEVLKRPGDRKAFKSIDGGNHVIHSLYADDDYIWHSGLEAMRWNRSTGESNTILSGFEMQEMRARVPLISQSRIYHFDRWQDFMVMSSTRNVILYDLRSGSLKDLPTTIGGPLRDFVVDENGVIWLATNQDLPAKMDIYSGEYTRVEELALSATRRMPLQGLMMATLWWGNRLQGSVFARSTDR